MERRIPVSVRSAWHLLHPLPAMIVHPDTLVRWGIMPSIAATITIGDRSSAAWIVAASGNRAALFTEAVGQGEAPETAQVFLDWRSAQKLGVGEDGTSYGELSFAQTTLAVQPQRTDDRVTAGEAIVSAADLDALDARHGYVLVSSATRKIAVRLRESASGVPQRTGHIRVGFHTRVLLSLEMGDSGERPSVLVSRLPDISDTFGRWAAVRAWVGRLFGSIGEVLLRAPQVTLAVSESATADDDAGIVRCTQSAMNVIGIEPGDSVVVSWAGRSTSTRAFLTDQESRIDVGRTEIVTWSERSSGVPLPPESTVTVPAAVRNAIGAPRDGVVTVRRSLSGLVRKRTIGLAFPLVGVGISVAELGLNVWIGAAIFLAAAAFTLAGDRIVSPRVRVAHDSQRRRR